MTDFDNPWKEVLDRYFAAFLAFFFPKVHQDIDWSRGYEILDKELRKIQREAALGKRVTDQLVKVWLKEGAEVWVLIHVEVQNQVEANFPYRMFVYYFRILERYNRQVASFAIMGDEQPTWRPDRYIRELWECRNDFRYPVVKLLDYGQDWAALETNPNPFAVVVMAHLKTLETAHDPASRQTWKFRLVRGLYERGFQAKDVRNLFRFIDWIMSLPGELETAFLREVEEYEGEKHMPYITSVERIGFARGHKQGREEGREEGVAQGKLLALRSVIEDQLREKFAEAALPYIPALQRIPDEQSLRTLLKGIAKMTSPDDIKQYLP